MKWKLYLKFLYSIPSISMSSSSVLSKYDMNLELTNTLATETLAQFHTD